MAFTDTNGTKEPKMQISLVDAYLKRQRSGLEISTQYRVG